MNRNELGGGYGGGNFRDGDERLYEGGRVFGRRASAGTHPSQGWAGSAVSESMDASGGVGGRMPKNYARSDTRIRDDVCERLYHRHDLDLTDVDVTVQDGTVGLTGSVTYRAMKHRIEDVAAECMGVRDVDNELKVRRAPDASA